MAQGVLLKKILNEGFNFLRINLLQLKVGFFSLFQSEIKRIHQTLFSHLYQGGNNSRGRCI